MLVRSLAGSPARAATVLIVATLPEPAAAQGPPPTPDYAAPAPVNSPLAV